MSKARILKGKIDANTEAYLAGHISYGAFDVAAKALWAEVEAAGLRACVSLLIRQEEAAARK